MGKDLLNGGRTAPAVAGFLLLALADILAFARRRCMTR